MLQNGQIPKASGAAFLRAFANLVASWANDGGFSTLQMQIKPKITQLKVEDTKFWQIEHHFDKMGDQVLGYFAQFGNYQIFKPLKIKKLDQWAMRGSQF